MGDKDYFVSNLEFITAVSTVARALKVSAYTANVWLLNTINNKKQFTLNRDGYRLTEQGHHAIKQILGPHGYTIIKALNARSHDQTI